MRALFFALFAVSCGACLAAEGQPAFTRKPAATTAGDKVKIEFAVDCETDVAVFIEDAGTGAGSARIVRHLVAGVLGKNPPPPLKPNSLSQSVEWDGKADYGKPAGPGPFKVRVALGLGARYDRVMSSNRQNIVKVTALGTGPDGTLYVLASTWGAVWEGPQILAYNRDGTYQRMVAPFPAGLKKEQVRGITSFEPDGRPAPVLHNTSMGLYPDFSPVQPTNLCVSPDGAQLFVLCSAHGGGGHQSPSISVLGTDGSCAADKLTVLIGAPGKVGRPVFRPYSCIAVSPEMTHAYVGGVQPEAYDAKGQCAAVFRVRLPERTPCEPFFGDPAKPGKDETHLGGGPHGLAVDGKGNLFIADYANDRVVVVSENDGKYVGEFPTEKPDYLTVAPGSGAVYVTKRKGRLVEIVKFRVPAEVKGAKEVCRASVRMSRIDTYSAAVDCSAEPAVVWVGDRFGNLARLEDRGDKFGDAVKVSGGIEGYKSLPESYMAVAVDRRRKEIYARNSTGGGLYYRFSEETGKVEEVRIPGDAFGGGKGFQVMPHPDGNLYGLRWPYHFLRWDRTGKPLAWEEPIDPTDEEIRIHGDTPGKPISDGEAKYLKSKGRNTSFVPVSMLELPHTLGIRESDGHLFVFSPPRRGRMSKVLHEYLPTGRRVTAAPIIWEVSDAALGPKFDAAGNIYVAEVVRPKGWLYPPELAEHFQKAGIKETEGPAGVTAAFYGSITKFSPKGGMFDFLNDRYMPRPFTGEPRLPAGLKTVDVEYAGTQHKPAKVVGAEWIHPGIGHVGMFGCNCENVTFDVDPFGRVFFPDVPMYRVRVIDTNGNAITHFGGYGNAENMGPDSPVVDPRTGKVRPRRPDDPKALKSPFAEPEIAFAWLIGVGVTDKYAYMGDSLNRRLLRARLVYAAEAVCDVK